MQNPVALFIFAFLGIWIVGLFVSMMTGLSKIRLPQPASNTTIQDTLKSQHIESTQSKDDYKRAMEEYKYQAQKSRQNNPAASSQSTYRKAMDDLKFRSQSYRK